MKIYQDLTAMGDNERERMSLFGPLSGIIWAVRNIKSPPLRKTITPSTTPPLSAFKRCSTRQRGRRIPICSAAISS